jgi:hypothetical protein
MIKYFTKNNSFVISLNNLTYTIVSIYIVLLVPPLPSHLTITFINVVFIVLTITFSLH